MANSRFRPGTPFIRWTSLLAIIAAPIAAIVSIGGRAAGYGVVGRASLVLLVFCAIVMGPMVLFPPRPFGFTPMEPLDEREITIQRNFSARGHAAVAGLGVMVFWYMTLATEHEWWIPDHSDWLTLGILACCLFGGLPIALMHWAVRNPLDDEADQ